jgi:hypothetical protein
MGPLKFHQTVTFLPPKFAMMEGYKWENCVDNHSHNGNGNGNGWRMKSAVKSLQLFASDVVGNLAEVVFLKYQENFDKAVPWLKAGFKSMIAAPMAMVQPRIEQALEHAGNFEGKEEHDKRMHQTKEERLEGLLDSAYHYASAGLVGATALMGTEKVLSKLMKTPHTPNWVWACVDLPVHAGLIAAMAMPSMKPQTEALKGTIKNVMKASGWSDEKAEQDARFATVYIVPNYATWLSTSVVMTGLYSAEHAGKWNNNQGLFKNLGELAKKLGIGGAEQKTLTAV